MAKDILDLVQNDDGIYLYDPRPRRRSYRHRSRRRRPLYDPQPRRRTRIRSRLGRIYRSGRTRRKQTTMGKVWRGINHAAPVAAGLLSFFSASQLFADYNNQASKYALVGANTGTKLKWFFGMTIYRIGAALGQNWQIATGGPFNFPQQGTVPFGFKPWGAVNNISIGAGLVLVATHFFPGIPRAGLIRKSAWFALIGAAFGGSIDPSAPGSARASPGVLASSAPARAGATPLLAAYSSGSNVATSSTAGVGHSIGTLQ